MRAIFLSEHLPVPSRNSRDRMTLERAKDHARRRMHELFAPLGLAS